MTYLEVYNEKLMDLVASSTESLSEDQPTTRVTFREERCMGSRQVKIADAGSGKRMIKYLGMFCIIKTSLVHNWDMSLFEGMIEVKGASLCQIRSVEDVQHIL